MDYCKVRLKGEIFTIPEGVKVSDYVDINKVPVEVVENLCIYLCQGHRNKEALKTMMYVPHDVAKRYVAIRTPRTDKFLRTYGDGKAHHVRTFELLKEHGLQPSYLNKYYLKKDSLGALLTLCTELLTCPSTHLYCFEPRSLYNECVTVRHRYLQPDDKFFHNTVFIHKPIHTLYLIDTLLSKGVLLEKVEELIKYTKSERMTLDLQHAISCIDDLDFYLALNLTTPELVNTLLELKKQYKKKKPCDTILDLSQINYDELVQYSKRSYML